MTMLCVEVAQTILQQLGGAGRLKAMVGASGFVTLASTTRISGGLGFTIKAIGVPRINHITVSLNGKDLYDVVFYFKRGGKVKIVSEARDVYCDQLKSMIEKATGLYLSMGKVFA